MMPDFPSAAGTLSSWRGKEGKGEGAGRGEAGRQLERLPTAGNQLPVTESLHGAVRRSRRRKVKEKRLQVQSAGAETRSEVSRQWGVRRWLPSSSLSGSVVCH